MQTIDLLHKVFSIYKDSLACFRDNSRARAMDGYLVNLIDEHIADLGMSPSADTDQCQAAKRACEALREEILQGGAL